MTDRPATWFELNAPAVLIALLEIIVGTSSLLTPQRLTEQFGFVPPLSHIWLTGYIISGVLLLWGLWRNRVDITVYATVLMVAANLLQLLRTAALLGTDAALRDTAVSTVLIVTMTLWLRALFRGGTFVVPAWKRKR